MRSEKNINILVFNPGSSSVKYRLISMPEEKDLILGEAERVGIKTTGSSFISHVVLGEKRVINIDMPDHSTAFKCILAAIEEAVETINADPTQWEATLVENNILPAPLQGKFQVPSFVTAGVPSPEQFADVLAWAQEKELISGDVRYEQCISSDFLP